MTSVGFRLSDKTKAMLNQNKARFMNAKPKGYYNSKEFYQRCPDLAPRNIYLREGRLLDMETVKKYLDNIGRKSILQDIKDKVIDFWGNLIRSK